MIPKLTKTILVALFLIFTTSSVMAQDDLMDMLNATEEERTDFTIATFKTSRLVTGHSIETHAKRTFYFIIQHRFGRLNSGFKQLFGIDNAAIRFGLEYGITDQLNVGIGRSSVEATYDGFVKYKVLRQSTGKWNVPITVTLLATASIKGNDFEDPDRDNLFSSRMFYSFQALIARKFNKSVSVQVMPTLVHRNLVTLEADQNDVFALGVGGRFKVTGSLTLNFEYYWIPSGQIVSPFGGEEVRNSISVGIDLETGGHVFQFHLTNSRAMNNKGFITQTNGLWSDGAIHLGFNISRVFSLKKKHAPGEKPKKKKKEGAEEGIGS